MNTNELLQRFVAHDQDIRDHLRQPILRGEWIYATNSHIIVRVPRADGIDTRESDKPAGLADLFEKNRRDEFIALPDLPPGEKCNVCSGSGIGYKCLDCDGEGAFDYGCHSYRCKGCDGVGRVDDGDDADKEPCLECDGSGERHGQAIKVEIWHYDRRYLAKIYDLPGLKFSQRQEGPQSWDDTPPAYFSFTGGEGLLMPLRVGGAG